MPKFTTEERQELVEEIQMMRRLQIVRILVRKRKVKAATLKQKSKAELVETLVDALAEGAVKFSDLG